MQASGGKGGGGGKGGQRRPAQPKQKLVPRESTTHQKCSARGSNLLTTLQRNSTAVLSTLAMLNPGAAPMPLRSNANVGEWLVQVTSYLPTANVSDDGTAVKLGGRDFVFEGPDGPGAEAPAAAAAAGGGAVHSAPLLPTVQADIKIKPDAKERTGTGHGNVLMPLQGRVVAEVQQVNALAAAIQLHAKDCSKCDLALLHHKTAQPDACKVGFIGCFAFRCAGCGRVIRWNSSAEKMQGAPTTAAPAVAAPPGEANTTAPVFGPARRPLLPRGAFVRFRAKRLAEVRASGRNLSTAEANRQFADEWSALPYADKCTYRGNGATEESDEGADLVREPLLLRRKLIEAIAHHEFVTPGFSRAQLANTMKLSAKQILYDFLGPNERTPRKANLEKMAAWLAANPTPPPPLDDGSDKFDFFLNYELLASMHLTGVQYSRFHDFCNVSRLADLNENFDTRVKAELACSILDMDREDTARIVAWCDEIGDKRLGFDAGHGQNRNSKHAYGTFMTHVLGLCVLCQVTDKDRSTFCAGVAQRGEKEALITGLRRLVELGLTPENVTTDQCSGASVDIANVARALGLTIVHDWDAYHVIVTVKKKWEAYIAAKCKPVAYPTPPTRPGQKMKKPKNMNTTELDTALRALFPEFSDLEATHKERKCQCGSAVLTHCSASV